MMQVRSKPVLIGAPAALLLALALWQTLAPVSAPAIATPASVGKSLVADGSGKSQSSMLPRETYAEIEQRPLFVPGRRPPAPEPVARAPVSQPQTLEHYTVLGIVAAPARAVALIKGTGGETLHVRVGQALEGWTLEAITPNRLVFASGEQKQELDFKIAKSRQDQSGVRMNNRMPGQ